VAGINFRSILTKAITGSVAVTAVFVLASGNVIGEMGKQERDLAHIDGVAGVVVNRVMPLATLIADIRFDVVEVQQFLSDISATRGQDGLDDGLEKAAGHAASFHRNIAAALDVARVLEAGDIVRALDETRKGFDPYYKVGQAMAQAYVDGGPPAGNALMPQFDAVAETLGERLTELVRISADVSRVRLAELTGAIGDIREGNARIRTVGAMALSGVVAVIAAAVAFLLSGVISPLRRMTRAMLGLARGDLTVANTEKGRRDEIGAMADTLEVFRGHAGEVERLNEERAAQTERAAAMTRQALLTMADTVETETRTAVEQVEEQSGRMAAAACVMAYAADQVTNGAVEASTAADQALANAQTVAAAAEQMSAAIREISEQISRTSQVTQGAVECGDKAQGTIGRLSEAVGRINTVAKLINAIASQTNLLALNATIEAARAGDAGRGFAVVANEVKALANQTGQSTEEITRLIAEIHAITQAAVTDVGSIGAAIVEVDRISGSVAAAVEQQEAATREIARSVSEVAGAAGDVTRQIAGISDEAAKSGAQAEMVQLAATKVADAISGMREVLVRVVRTATPDVNRRGKPRYALTRPGTVTVAGVQTVVTVLNLSEDGALVSGAAIGTPGAHGHLRIDGVAPVLPFRALACDGDRVHLHFELDQAMEAGFAAAFRTLTAGLAPQPQSQSQSQPEAA
jgi:methyl-accepting chemotaxis protein